jgi:hypothetical protein
MSISEWIATIDGYVSGRISNGNSYPSANSFFSGGAYGVFSGVWSE